MSLVGAMREKGKKRQADKSMSDYVNLVKDFQQRRSELTGLEIEIRRNTPSSVQKSPGRSDADSDLASDSDDYDISGARPTTPRPGQRRSIPDAMDEALPAYATKSRHSIAGAAPPKRFSPRNSPSRAMDVSGSYSCWNTNRKGSKQESLERRVTANVRNLPPLQRESSVLLDQGRRTPQASPSYLGSSHDDSYRRPAKPMLRPTLVREDTVILERPMSRVEEHAERPVSRAGRGLVREATQSIERPKSRAGRAFMRDRNGRT